MQRQTFKYILCSKVVNVLSSEYTVVCGLLIVKAEIDGDS